MIKIKVGSISDTEFTKIYFLLKIGRRKSNELAANGFGVALEKPPECTVISINYNIFHYLRYILQQSKSILNLFD
jgi:hypothetical protein